MELIDMTVPGGAVPTAAPETGLPAEPVQPGIQPNGVDVAPETPVAEPEFKYILPTGTKYRDEQDLINGAIEKDFTIERLKAQVATQSQNPGMQQQAAPQAPTDDARFQRVVGNIERRLMANPRYAGADREAIREQAELQAYSVIESDDLAQQARMVAEHQRTIDNIPEFNLPHLQPLADLVYERAAAAGNPFRTPQEHRDAVQAEMFRRGIPMPQSQAGNVGVTAAMQQVQQAGRIFSNVQGGAPPAQGGPLSPVVQRQIQFAISKGITGAELEQVKQYALQNEAASRQ